MSDRVIRLIYPASLLHVPIINQLIRQYDLTVNILKAQIGENQGWLEIQLAGAPLVIDDAIVWLKAQGIDVQIEG